MDLLNNRFEFSGAKIALLHDNHLISILRDDIPTIPFPNTWDLPGGGREENETPFECLQREVFEELGISISKESIDWAKKYPGLINPSQTSVFMVGSISQEQINAIIFGDEGQTYKLMPIEEFLVNNQVYGSMQTRLRDYLEVSNHHIE